MQRVARAIYDELRGVDDIPICYLGIYDDATQPAHVVCQVHEGRELSGGSFPVGILDERGTIVRVHSAARRLPCEPDASIVLGEPLDCIGYDRSLHRQSQLIGKLRSLVAILMKGHTPSVGEIQVGADKAQVRSRGEAFAFTARHRCRRCDRAPRSE